MNLPVPLQGMVIEKEIRKAKNGTSFGTMVVRCPVGDLKTITFDLPPSDPDSVLPAKGDIIQINNYVDELAERGNLKIKHPDIIQISRDDLGDTAFLEGPKASAEEMQWALGAITDKTLWSDPKYSRFVMDCLKAFGADKLKECPAGTHIHHTRRGDLMLHTAEVLNYCKAIVEARRDVYDFLSTDVLYAAAIVHDLGKLVTYYFDELGVARQKLSEKSVSHFVNGAHVIMSVAEKHPELSEDYVDEVLHCVVSHHGQVIWGSVVECKSIEADILAKADYISSRDSTMLINLQDRTGVQDIPDTFKLYSNTYIRTMGIVRYVNNTRVEA